MNDSVKRVYTGLPEILSKKVRWVSREYRTNPLSHDPGGSDVIVEYHKGTVLGYDWIKFPSKYIRKIFNGEISRKNETFESLNSSQQVEIFRVEVRRIYARKYEKDEDFENIPFREIWNHDSPQDPWSMLEDYDHRKKFTR
jgi:hypothetical protein